MDINGERDNLLEEWVRDEAFTPVEPAAQRALWRENRATGKTVNREEWLGMLITLRYGVPDEANATPECTVVWHNRQICDCYKGAKTGPLGPMPQG